MQAQGLHANLSAESLEWERHSPFTLIAVSKVVLRGVPVCCRPDVNTFLTFTNLSHLQSESWSSPPQPAPLAVFPVLIKSNPPAICAHQTPLVTCGSFPLRCPMPTVITLSQATIIPGLDDCKSCQAGLPAFALCLPTAHDSYQQVTLNMEVRVVPKKREKKKIFFCSKPSEDLPCHSVSLVLSFSPFPLHWLPSQPALW